MRSLHDNLLATPSLSPAAYTNANDGDGTGVDCADADAVQFLVSVGTWTDGDHTVTFKHSDDGVTYAAIPAASLDEKVDGTLEADGTLLIDDDSEDDSVIQVGYIGGKRYVLVSNAVANDTDGAVYGAAVEVGRLRSTGVSPMDPAWQS